MSEINDTATSAVGRSTSVTHALLAWVAPGILAAVTLLTASLANGFAFAYAVVIAYSGHAAGHYLWARRYSVASHLPFFVPAASFIGTGGVYTKMRWPITDRRALIRIFTGGPIAGCCVSWIVFLAGLTTSKVAEMSTEGLVLGDSLLTYSSQLLVFGRLPETQTIELSPIAFAGWSGLG